MNRMTVRTLKIVAPLLLLGVAGLVAGVMIWNRPPVEVQVPVFTPPGVRVEAVTLRDVPFSVTSQGTVRPRTESQLVTEIAGRVTSIAPSFAEGGFFESGDVLVTVDPFDYQQAVVSARSQLAQARLRLAQEEAEAEVAIREWDALGRGDPRALTLREPHLEDARASVAGAEASLERAERDLERAEIVAPYAGRIRQKNVDIGQFVRVGDAVATIYAVDSAEVRLPLPDEQLAYLDLPLSYRGGSDQPQPRVTLRATFAGEAHEWQGRIVRTESEIDPVSRMVHAVAEVLDPYAPGPNRRRPPLAVGMYVEAEIAGRTVRNVAVVPRAAMRGRDRVLVVDAGDRLSFREIDILRATTDAIYVRSGLAEGELVVVSPLDTPTEGMRVQLADADADLLARRRDRAPAEAPAVTNDAAARDRASAAGAPGAASFDRDPSLSRDEQIAAIRRQLAVLAGTPVASAAGTPPDASPVIDRASAPGAADSDRDPTLSGDEQIAAIRRQLAALRSTTAAPPTGTTTDASPDRPAAPRRVADAGAGATVAAPDTAAGTSGPSGTGAGVGRGARGERRGRGGRGGRGARGVGGRRDGPTAIGAAPSATPRVESDTAPTPAAPLPEPAAPVPEPAARPAGFADAVPSVAVLPFVNVSRNPADDWISTDMTVAVQTALERTGAMGVVTFAAADESTALETAGARGARWLVGGGYQRVGDRLRITARVLDVAGGDLIRVVKVDGAVDALDTLTTEMVATVRAAVDDGGEAPRTIAARDLRRPDAGAGGLAPPTADVPAAVVVDAAPGGTATKTLVVLPFDDLSPSPSGDGVPNVDLGAAITDAVAARLAELAAVTVVSSDDGAAWVVGGGVQRIGGVVRVTARLVDVESGSVVTAVKLDGTIDALAELQARVVSAISDSVREALSAQDAATGRGADAEVAGAVERRP